MKKLIKFLSLFLEDYFILGGLGLIIYQTYLLNEIIAIYLLGLILFIIGLLLSRNPREIVENKVKK